MSGRIITLANQVEAAILGADHEAAADGLVSIAEMVLAVEVFTPETVLDTWRDVLRQWVRGLPLGDLQADRVVVARFIESDVIYRLIWGVEAARVFEAAQGNPDADTMVGTAVTAIETGTFNWAASILIRSGYDHRLPAISAVMSTGATFDSAVDMRQWISDLPRESRSAEIGRHLNHGQPRRPSHTGHGRRARIDGAAAARTWTTWSGTTRYRSRTLGCV